MELVRKVQQQLQAAGGVHDPADGDVSVEDAAADQSEPEYVRAAQFADAGFVTGVYQVLLWRRPGAEEDIPEEQCCVGDGNDDGYLPDAVVGSI